MEDKQYIQMMENVFQFTLYASDEYSAPTDYGTGKELDMVQVHTLSMIADNPGICVSEVAKMWNRTRGAASKNVQRLCDKGYVEKRKLEGDDKTVHLYPTESGMVLHELHKQYDLKHALATVEHLRTYHSEEDLLTFYKVLLTYIKLYEERRSAKED